MQELIIGEYSFFNKLYEITKTLYWLIQDSWSYFIWIILGVMLQLFLEKGVLKRISSLIIFALTYFVIFIGGNKLAYYSIPLMALAIYGIAYLGKILKLVSDRQNLNLPKSMGVLSVIVVLAGSVFFASKNTMNAEYRGFKEEDIWIVEASKLLTEDDTLLELNAVDAGLYTITGIVPSCEYFQTNGIGLPTMFEEQKKYLKEGRTDYVLAVGYEPEFIDINYSLIAKYDYQERDVEEQYFLYKKK